MRAQLQDWLPEGGKASWQKASDALCEAGVEPALAQDLSALEFIFPALDLVNLAQSADTTLEDAARTYFSVDAELGLTGWRTEINRLPTETLWQTQARGSARDDVYSIASQITLGLLSRKEPITEWRQRHEVAIRRLNQLLTMVSTQGADLAPVSVAMRELRQLA
jgi:glutamate dehydrogenase